MMFSRMVLAFSLFGHMANASEVPKAKYRQLDSILNKFVADVEAASPASDGGIRRRCDARRLRRPRQRPVLVLRQSGLQDAYPWATRQVPARPGRPRANGAERAVLTACHCAAIGDESTAPD